MMANVVMGRLFEAVSFQRTFRAVGSLLPKSLPSGSGRNARPGPNFRVLFPRPRNRATVRSRTFSAVRKSVVFPYYLPTSAFPGFAPNRLAGAFRWHSLVCPANGSSHLLARPAAQLTVTHRRLIAESFFPLRPPFLLKLSRTLTRHAGRRSPR